MIELNAEEVGIILHVLSNAEIGKLKGELIVPLANVMHKMHAKLMEHNENIRKKAQENQ